MISHTDHIFIHTPSQLSHNTHQILREGGSHANALLGEVVDRLKSISAIELGTYQEEREASARIRLCRKAQRTKGW